MDADQLIREYLSRLDELARQRVPGQATELVADVREHIEAAIAEIGLSDPETVRSVLDRLGPPDAIVNAAIDQHAGTPDQPSATLSMRRRRAPLARFGPWALGAVSGILGVALYLPPLTTYGFPAPVLPFMIVPVLLAVLVARRPGGVEFLVAALGVAGALTFALAASVPLSCPAGEFSSSCSGPRLAPLIAPSLGLIVLGALLMRSKGSLRDSKPQSGATSGDIPAR